MPRNHDEDEEDADEDFGDSDSEYDPDDPETYPAGVYADSELPLAACRSCGEDILEDSVQCPACGAYQSEEDAPAQPRSKSLMAATILALLAVLIWIFGRG